MLDELEHVFDQRKLLHEIFRVLKPEGIFIVTTPKKNIFSFLDVGNFKFMFPRLHKYFYIQKYGEEEYNYRYLNNPTGLIGDVEREKKWHQHFSEDELMDLLSQNGFRVEIFDGSCLFQRIFIVFDLLHLGRLVPTSWHQKDAQFFQSSNLFCVARKSSNGHRF
jgi:ubiquinone/menaquinone biosynthesis C-methylase UbiE